MHFIRTLFLGMPLVFSLLVASCRGKSSEKTYRELQKEVSQIQAEGNLADREALDNTLHRLDLFITENPKNKHTEELRRWRDTLASQRDKCHLFYIRNQYELLTSDTEHPLKELLQRTSTLLSEVNTSESQALLNRHPEAPDYAKELIEFRDYIQALEGIVTAEYASLEEYNNIVESRRLHFEKAPFPSISTLWAKFTDSRRKKLINMEIERAIDSIVPALEQEASARSLYNHKHYKIHSIELISRSQPSWVKSPSNGMICEATFRVNMVGSWLGIDRGTAKVAVKGGVFQTDSMGSLTYRILDHSELETTGDL